MEWIREVVDSKRMAFARYSASDLVREALWRFRGGVEGEGPVREIPAPVTPREPVTLRPELRDVPVNESGVGRSVDAYLAQRPGSQVPAVGRERVVGESGVQTSGVQRDTGEDDPEVAAERALRAEFTPKQIVEAGKRIRGWEKLTWAKRLEGLREQKEREAGS